MGAPRTAPYSPASSIASSSATLAPADVQRPNYPRQRSRGQLARHQSTTAGRLGLDADQPLLQPLHSSALSEPLVAVAGPSGPAARRNTSGSRRGRRRDLPSVGGLYYSDLIFIALTYILNLVRTCGLAELFDVAFGAIIYICSSLVRDFYNRWTLSSAGARRPTHYRNRSDDIPTRGRSAKPRYVVRAPAHCESEPTYARVPTSYAPPQLSPFHHLIILLVRFTCSHFPHLLPRVLFAEETIGPFVYWRTGGGSNALVQEFTDLDVDDGTHGSGSGTARLERGGEAEEEQKIPGAPTAEPASASSAPATPGFRAFWISKDARLPVAVQRANKGARTATTLLYLHGGGFSLGSVAFYAESLLRLRAKVSALEAARGVAAESDARCVAVEYDLAPTARFPTPLLQCLRCYAHLVEVERVDPQSICIAGDSAGGNLAMGMLLALSGQAKDEPKLGERDWSALPMPGKAVLISPWVDLRPSKAHAFAPLRQQDKDIHSHSFASVEEQIDDFEWDYVASEALLHFAQVYSGVLPSPRRVRGPLGWLAHLCGMIGKEDEEPQASSSKHAASPHRARKSSFATPRALESLLGPGRKLARATHEALCEPVFSQFMGKPDASTPLGADAPYHHHSLVSAGGGVASTGLEPLFPAQERYTELVRSKEELYAPFTESSHAHGGVDPKDDASRAKAMLESHPLLSPAMGDWQAVKLKHGMLVTWGERERLATDIENWVDAIHKGHAAEADRSRSDSDAPSQDSDDSPRLRGAHFDEANGKAEWLQTVVEHGPGGVHAWPFVSMYLAGEESEREKGLDMLAWFLARAPPARSTHPTSLPAPGDPPHAAPYSPLYSPGSMPSDIDMHGGVDAGSSEESSDADAYARDQYPAVADTGLGLSGFGGLESPTSPHRVQEFESEGPQPDVESESSGSDADDAATIRTPRGGSGVRQSRPLNAPSSSAYFESVTLEHTTTTHTTHSSAGASAFEDESFRAVPLTLPGQALRITMPGNVESTVPQRGRTVQAALPLWWTRREEEHVLPADVSQSDRLDDIEEASNETFSPARSLSPGAPQSSSAVPMDPSFYGMSHYTFRRPEPEGLSDILEEESNLSASVASMGGMEALSPPPRGGFAGADMLRGVSSASSVEQDDEEEEDVFSQSDDGLHEDEEGEMSWGEQAVARLAQRQAHPPASSLTGQHALGTMHSAAWQSSGDISTSPSATSALAPSSEQEMETREQTEDARTLRPSSSRASLDSVGSNSSRKKPKGDMVWW